MTCFAVIANGVGHGEDFFLTIGGGYSPSGNQASIENNVLFFQRALRDNGLQDKPSNWFFADGDDEKGTGVNTAVQRHCCRMLTAILTLLNQAANSIWSRTCLTIAT